MKKNILNIFYLFSGLLVLLYVAGELLENAALKVDPNEPKVQQVLSLEEEDYNTLIFGNSITQQGINPMVLDSILGTMSYNMAIGGASIFTMELLLRNYLLKNKKPENVIYGLYINEKEWLDKVRPTIVKNLDPTIVSDYYDSNPDAVGRGSMDFYNEFKAFRYRNVIEHYLKYLLNSDLYSYSYNQGFLIRKTVAKPIDDVPPNIAGLNFKALKRLKEFCESEDIKLTLVELPNHQVFNDATSNRDSILNELNNQLNYNVDLIDLNNPENYSDKDWASLNHLNFEGANTFSLILANKLKASKPKE